MLRNSRDANSWTQCSAVYTYVMKYVFLVEAGCRTHLWELSKFFQVVLGAVPSGITKLTANNPIHCSCPKVGIITDSVTTTSNPEFLSLGPFGIWGWITLAVGRCPLHCRVVSSVPWPLQGASAYRSWQPKMSPGWRGGLPNIPWGWNITPSWEQMTSTASPESRNANIYPESKRLFQNPHPPDPDLSPHHSRGPLQ